MDDRPYDFKCNICDEWFEHAGDLQDHQMKKHGLSFQQTIMPEYSTVKSRKTGRCIP